MSLLEVPGWTLTPFKVDEPESATTNDTLATDGNAISEHKAAWQEIIDERLVEWGRDPSLVADDGLIPPSKRAVQAAIHVADALSREGFAAPKRVVPDGDGGIVLERWNHGVSTAIEIGEDGAIEIVRYDGNRLVSRYCVARGDD